jgi:hypothetical protein
MRISIRSDATRGWFSITRSSRIGSVLLGSACAALRLIPALFCSVLFASASEANVTTRSFPVVGWGLAGTYSGETVAKKATDKDTDTDTRPPRWLWTGNVGREPAGRECGLELPYRTWRRESGNLRLDLGQ